MSATNKPRRLRLVRILGIALLLLPLKALAGLTEYALILALIAIIAIAALKLNLPLGSQLVIDQLTTSIEGARAANIVGNSTAELTRLSKAAGAAQALMGMTAACSDCGDFRATLQQIIGQIALLKTSIAGASGTCNPNGIVQPNEQCDPLAINTGCPTNATLPLYCSDECTCEIVLVP
jgi:Flp pilus assembly pilin Flp